MKEGVYLIKVNGDSYQYNVKLISNNSLEDHPDIRYLGFLAIQNILKSTLTPENTLATVLMDYNWGDSIRYIGYSNSYVDTIYDMPSSSRTVTFLFPGIPIVNTKTVSNISYFTSVCGGNITNDCGAPVTARGVCWSTTGKPTLADNYTTDGTGTGTFVSNITALKPNTLYNVRAYATNFMGTAYGLNQYVITLNFIPGHPYEGGIIGYILNASDQDYVAGQIRGIIVPPTDQSKGIQWYNGSSIKTNATATWVGAGKQNTEAIVAIQGAGSYAAQLCNDLVLNGYSDWYLPSKDELPKILKNSDSIGGFSYDNYWTSTETSYNSNKVYYYDFKYSFSDDTTKNMKYCVRAARNMNPVFFLPVLTTTAITTITETTIKVGGYISTDGGQNITERGVCWNVNPNHTISNSKIKDGNTGRGSFLCTVTGLIPSSIYYFRAYATTISGTSYGNEDTFIVISDLPSTKVITDITQTSAKSGGTVTKDGGSSITARGVCWSVNPIPTISDNKTTDGTGLGIFTSSITGLSPKTKYYVCAYATNSSGTVYGNILSFITEQAAGPTVTDFDGNVYDTVHIGTQIWMKQNLNVTHYSNGEIIPNVTDISAWRNLTTGAYCDYDNTPSNSTTYGRLYNWYSGVDSRYLCPAGWYVPTQNDLTTLVNYLGGTSIAGGKLKESGTTHWKTPNTDATNSSKFTALPGGGRDAAYSYVFLNYIGIWWSSTDYYTGDGTAWILNLDNTSANATLYNGGMDPGASMRCIKK